MLYLTKSGRRPALLSAAFAACILALMSGHLAAAEDYAAAGARCSAIADKMNRLLCFDALFKTPVPAAAAPAQPAAGETIIPAAPQGPMQQMAAFLERQRDPAFSGWIIRMRKHGETNLLTAEDYEKSGRALGSGDQSAQNADVFMTMRQADAPAGAAGATLMLSCENNITTLAVILPQPISTLQADIALSVSSGSVFRLHWRDVENGAALIAGRGLESIDTIKTISNYSRMLLQIDYPGGARSFAFDINKLKDGLKPLRAACHWQGGR